jgi:hypothetical protein
VRDRWSIEGWHWIRDTQLHEDAHRYRSDGDAADGSPQPDPTGWISVDPSRYAAVMHDVTTLVGMALRQPRPEPD